MAQNPFDQFDAPAQPATRRVGPANPKTGMETTRLGQQIQQGAATLPYEGPKAAADLAKTRQAISDRPFERGDKLRNDFTGDTRVKEYNAVIPILMSGLQTAKNAAGDNALIYAYAKVMDPGSVVRESEGETAANTAGYWDSKVEQFKKNLGWSDARGLPAKAAENLRAEMNRKVSTLAKTYGVARSDYQRRAQRQGVNPDDVVGGFPGEPFFKQYDQLRKRGFGDEKAAATAGAIQQRTGGTPPVNLVTPAPTIGGGKPMLSSEDQSFISANARYMTPQGMKQWFKDRNLTLNDQEAQQAFDYYSKGGSQNVDVRPPSAVENILNSAASSPIGSYFGGAANALTGGTLDELAGLTGGDAGRAQQAKDLMAQQNPVANTLGNVTGAGLSMLGINRAAGMIPGIAGRALTAGGGIGADALYGAGFGAGEGNGNRGLNALLGAGGAVAGNLGGQALGRYVGAPIAGAIGRRFGGAAPVSAAEQAITGGAQRTGVQGIIDFMNEAQGLGVPATLADASPELRALAGAAVRRSPTASGIAEQNLIPRGRAQIERLQSAVERDLGPVANIPQRSEDLINQASAAAAPLYRAAYEAPGATAINLSDMLARPSVKKAFGPAARIAQEEGVDPMTLGFRFNDKGEAIAIEAPSWQTLDYIKRGLDDVVEGSKNPNTGRLNTEGRAVDNTRKEFLSRIDAMNPDYAAARQAYAGPMQERQFLQAGKDAVTANPQELGVSMRGATPQQIEQMQLGYRSGLMNQGDRLRYGTNPFESVLGTPQAEQRLATMYPSQPGVERLLKQRDLELGLAATTNDILGNSKTAQRQIADEAFRTGEGARMAIEGIASAASGVPVAPTIINRLGRAAGNAYDATLGRATVRKADEIAPVLTNPDTSAVLSQLNDILSRSQAYSDYINGIRTNARRIGGGIGGAIGLGLAQ